MLRLTFAFLIAISVPLAGSLRAQPLDWIERYALSTNRDAVLAELIPGSEEFYFYYCLNYQVSGQLEKAEALLAQWKADERARYSGYLQRIEDRQRLLTYTRLPDQAIEYFRNRLNIQLEHPAPTTAGQQLYPSAFDNAQLNVRQLVDQVDQSDLTRTGLRYLAERVLTGDAILDRDRLAALVNRVDGPWMPNLEKLVIKELQLANTTERSFGDRAAHQWLTLAELQEVAKAVPAVAASNQMVAQVLLRLRPSDDVDMRQQPDAQKAYLKRVDEYVTTLPDAFISLKAATLHQRLALDLSSGEFDLEMFLRYLRMPRSSNIVPEPQATASRVTAELGQDFTDLAIVPAIGDEQPLIRTYLEHFLKDAETTASFDGMLRPDYLRAVFAETKLLNGVEPAERWYAMLDPASRQAVRDRVELTLAPTNLRNHIASAPSSLVVDLKRVEKLVVRIYRINTHSYYRTRTKQIDTDIDLDGLVPTAERQIEYSFAPGRRHRETIVLPEIEGRGVWIVDLLGGGLRARAMIRRGELQYAIAQSANGLRLTALDEDRTAIPGAKLLVAGQALVANEDGQIEIPPLDQAVQRIAVLHDSLLAIPVSFPHLAESYSLQAAMHVDRQQLQSGRQADLVVRPRLLMAGKAIDPATLQDVKVTIIATDRDGIATTKRFEKLTLDQANDLVLSLRVPPRLATLRAELTGKIHGLAKNDLKDLSASQSWDVASIRQTTFTSAAHLTRNGENWIIETRGRSGEVIAGQMVQVKLHPSVRTSVVHATLQTDAQGRIDLGSLVGIDALEITYGGQSSFNDLRDIETSWPVRINRVAATEIRLAIPSAAADAKRFRLFSLRGGDRLQTDLSSLLSISGGHLTIKPLDPGNYKLHDVELQTQVLLCVTDGPIRSDIAVGTARQLELGPRSEVGIESIVKNAAGLKVKISGSSPLTRVHLIANRFIDRWQAIDDMRLPDLPVTMRGVWHAASGYISDLRLGEEYQYVLRRQYATKYPGVMLPQPGLILNPWETRSADNQSQTAAEGDAPTAAAMAPTPMADAAMAAKEKAEAAGNLTPDYDFLADSGAVATNLHPDKDGFVLIPNDVIDGMPVVQVIVTDPVTVIRRIVYQPLVEAELLDLRLAQSLEAKQAFAFARGVVIAAPDKPLDLKSLGSAQIQLYSSIADLMRLYLTLQGDKRLQEFLPIGSWHTLDIDAKKALYGRLACHELHLFLSVHDPLFFEKIVRPYLQNKLEKQFVDHYLLGNDLTPWTQMWRYRELNAAEKLLLARRIPAMANTVRREFKELVELRPDDAAVLRKLVESGLAGSAMFDSDGHRSMLGLPIVLDRAGSNARWEVDLGQSASSLEFQASNGKAKDMLKRNRAARSMESSAGADKTSDGRELERLSARFGRDMQPFFQNLDITKQWAESQWDRVRVTSSGGVQTTVEGSGALQSPELISVDPFWLALANANGNGNGGVLNEHVLRPCGSRHAALVALAFCGLPLNAGDVKLPDDDKPFTPPHPVAIVTKRLVSLEPMQGEASLLVGQRFSAIGEDGPNDSTAELPVAPNEFLTHHVYRGEVIFTNPTPRRRTVDVLWQVPAGSLPLAGGQATDSQTLTLEPFAVQRIEYSFYFPKAGDFAHYPVSVGVDGRVVARGNERTFNVVATPSKLDEDSWPAIAAAGDAAKIDAFLVKSNLRKIDLGLVAHRMRDRAIYDVVKKSLVSNQIERPELWGYAFHHRDADGMKTFLSQNSIIVGSVGPVLQSDLLDINPVERRTHEFLEYSPLVQARIHPLKAEKDILNPTFKEQYLNLLRTLAHQSAPDVAQQLSVVHYLLIENRIEEAIKRFAKIEPNEVSAKLQYDYLAGYFALHRSDYATALQLATKHESHPVPRWRERFVAMLTNLRQRDQLMQGSQLATVEVDKAEGITKNDGDLSLLDRDNRNADSASLEAFVKVDVDGSSLKIEYRNTNSVIVNLYAVDLELLFSKTPFVREDLATMAMVEPTSSETIKLDSGIGIRQLKLDDRLARQTLLVEVVSGAARSTTLYYGGKLSAYVSQGFGQLQVSDSGTRQPVEAAYVKVYARNQDGSVSFYKDGYTDLRGRYDYVSLSTGDLASIQRFSILVIDPERGATLQEAAPPTR